MAKLRACAGELGLIWGGIAPAIDPRGFSDLVNWIDAGFAGEMTYISDRLDAYRHPDGVLEGARSIIVLGMAYDAGPRPPNDNAGCVARYAWGRIDYHDVIHPKLKHLCRLLAESFPGSRSRGVVDTAPLLEREVAQLAGFGWRGKNTLLLNKHYGSYFFIACLLTDVELPLNAPHETTHCGTCTACLDACPTDAFPQAGVIDARRCISYLTIEHQSQIPIELRAGMGDWLFGCDVCQEVCPWNRKPARQAVAQIAASTSIDLIQLFQMNDDQFRRRFRKTPMWRTRRRGMLRNAAIVMGNRPCPENIPALEMGLHDPEPMVRGAAAWALGNHAGPAIRPLLVDRLGSESVNEVRSEIERSLTLLPT